MNVARAELQKVFDISTSSQSTSSFEWQDGIVLKAMQRGHWLAVSHSNLCPASVLDRLNSLLEPDGSLLLTEGVYGVLVCCYGVVFELLEYCLSYYRRGN